MSAKKVILLGATGMVGEACSLKFLNEGYIVYGIARNQPKDALFRSEQFIFIALDLTYEQEKLCELIKEITPDSIVVASGNHYAMDDFTTSNNLFKLHFDLLNNILNAPSNLSPTNNCSIVFCSSIMAYIPDRKYPSYAASKAGLNQYILSYAAQKNTTISLSAIVLGPVDKTNDSIFSVNPQKVADRIFKLSQNNANALYFFPFYGKLIAVYTLLFPFFMERIIFSLRRA